MDEKSKEDEVIDVLKVMNEDENIHGILMFRPLPPHIDEDRVRNHIESRQDDGRNIRRQRRKPVHRK